MSLVYALAPLALLAIGWLLINLFAKWFDRRRERRGPVEPPVDDTDAAPVVRKRGLIAGSAGELSSQPAPVSAPAQSPVQDPSPSPGPSAPLAPSPVPGTGEQAVSAVLRRQIPPRDEAPRSWLGGLPFMPDGVEWPRAVSSEYPEQGERPLHFLAQIACEDLPPDLWGGIGPRTGWLLFFIDPNSCTGDGEGDRAVIHTHELGTERTPPFDLGPVHDRMYTGGSYRWLDAEDVPNVWRRWPVDIVPVENRLYEHDGYKTASPDDFAQVLYEGLPVAEQEHSTNLPVLRPQTFAQARLAAQDLAKRMRAAHRDGLDKRAREPLLAEGGKDQLMAQLQSQIERFEKNPQLNQEMLAFLHRMATLFEPLDAPQILAHIEEVEAKRIAWREKIATTADKIAELLADHGDADLAEDQWEELQATFAGKSFEYIQLSYRDWGDKPDPFILLGPSETAELTPPTSMASVASEYYRDPAQRHRLPADWIEAHEPVFRKLYNNRPHRMGGYHDGLQSEPIEDPSWRNLLLLQIATDNAMDWCWGDAGAYYFWIRPDHLAQADFSGTEVWLECH